MYRPSNISFLRVGKNKFEKIKNMNVLSLFDGMSCGQIALNKCGIEYDNYFASEIEEPAIKVALDNYPNTKQLGDVTKVKAEDLPQIDLLIGGSPCQTVSLANKGGGEITEGKSSLFFEYLRILKETKPKYFLLENVPMSKKSMDTITELLGVEPIVINSNLVSLQNRKRIYWTNIPGVTQPNDLGLKLADLHCKEYDESLVLKGKGLNKLDRPRNRAIDINSDKAPTLMKSQEKKPTDSVVFKQGDIYRYPTRRECELMQTVPLNYTKAVNYRNATGMLGNGWTVDVIAHIFNQMALQKPKSVGN